MAKTGKKYLAAREKVGEADKLAVSEALGKVVEAAYVKFDETVDVAVRLGVDPKHADQMVRGTVGLPHGRGKTVRVVVFAKGEKEKEARDAGAEAAGSDHVVQHFDRVVLNDAHVGQRVGLDQPQQAADAGRVHFDPEIIVMRVR